jgi:hypothetical protein
MGSKNREHAMRILMMALGLCAGATVCLGQTPTPSPAGSPASAPAAEPAQPAPVAAVVVPPEAPLTPPKVTCAGDELTISANNSTLSSVLNEVRRCMGTKIDIPSEAGAKRLFDKIGPGKASQVLDVLLSNTGYNYIIGASPSNEDKIESIVLLSRSNDANAPAQVEDTRTGSNSRRAFAQMHNASIPHPMTEADEAAASGLGKVKEPSAAAPAENATPAPADGQQPATDPNQKPAGAAPAQADNSATPPAPPDPPADNNNYNTKPKTTEQQIVNMQQMFELRKQMTQQQSQPPQQQPQP